MSTDANWANLLTAGARSRSSVGSITAASSRPAAGAFGFSSPALLFLVLLVIIIVIAVRTRTTTAVAAAPASAVAAVAEPIIDQVQTVQVEPDQAAPVDETVQPKFAALTNKWFNSDVEDLDITAPLGDAEAGYSFNDFQRALLSSDSRAPVTVRRHEKAGDGYAFEQLQPLKDMIHKSGRSVDQFVSEHMITLPEEVLEMWTSPSSARRAEKAFTRPDCTAEESNMLVREALQDVPRGEAHDAAMVLREILHARTEAAKVGVQVPEIPEEQRAAIKSWAASGQQPAADIANVILSRA